MGVHHAELEVRTRRAGTVEITEAIQRELGRSKFRSGVATVFCPHTSCSLVAMENASPEARADLETWLNRLVPPDRAFAHNLEGADDMPSHIKMALTRTSEAIPFDGGRLLLGVWQGIYLWEHRAAPHTRRLHLTLIGE